MTLLYWGRNVIPSWLLRSIFSRFGDQLLIRVVSFRKSWREFDKNLILPLEIRFRSFVQPVLENSSAVWCLVAETHIKLPDRVVNGGSFLNECVIQCNIVHCRSVVALWLYGIYFKLQCIHHFYGLLPVPLVPVRVTSYAVVSSVSSLLVVEPAVFYCKTAWLVGVPYDFYSPLSIPVERSWWSCIRLVWF